MCVFLLVWNLERQPVSVFVFECTLHFMLQQTGCRTMPNRSINGMEYLCDVKRVVKQHRLTSLDSSFVSFCICFWHFVLSLLFLLADSILCVVVQMPATNVSFVSFSCSHESYSRSCSIFLCRSVFISTSICYGSRNE